MGACRVPSTWGLVFGLEIITSMQKILPLNNSPPRLSLNFDKERRESLRQTCMWECCLSLFETWPSSSQGSLWRERVPERTHRSTLQSTGLKNLGINLIKIRRQFSENTETEERVKQPETWSAAKSRLLEKWSSFLVNHTKRKGKNWGKKSIFWKTLKIHTNYGNLHISFWSVNQINHKNVIIAKMWNPDYFLLLRNDCLLFLRVIMVLPLSKRKNQYLSD